MCQPNQIVVREIQESKISCKSILIADVAACECLVIIVRCSLVVYFRIALFGVYI